MSIKLRKKPAALVPTPDGVYVQLFVDEDGLPKLKDSDGNVVQLSESAILTLVEQGSDPASAANRIKLYGKDVAGNTELFAVDSDGNEVQITDDGSIAGGGPATQLATSGSPVTVSGSAPPVSGRVLTSTSPTTATWQDLPVTIGGLQYSAIVHGNGNFTAVPGTMHRWDPDAAPNAILPDPPANNDKIGFIATGVGTGNLFIDPGTQTIAFNDNLFNSYQVGGQTGDIISFTLQFDDDLACWRVVDTEATRVTLLNDQPQQTMTFKGQDNLLNFVTVDPNSVLGRSGSGDIESILISSLGGGPADELATTGSPVDVSGASPPSIGQVLTATSATSANWQTPSGGGTRNSVWDPPLSPDAADEEFETDPFLGGSWTVYLGVGLTPATRAGDVDPKTYPIAGTYRSTLSGSTVYIQVPDTADCYLAKAVPSPTSGDQFWMAGIGFLNHLNATSSASQIYLFTSADSGGKPDPNNKVFSGINNTNSNDQSDFLSLVYSGGSPTVIQSYINGGMSVSGMPGFYIRKGSSLMTGSSSTSVNCGMFSPFGNLSSGAQGTSFSGNWAWAGFFLSPGAGASSPEAAWGQIYALHFIRRKLSSSAYLFG